MYKLMDKSSVIVRLCYTGISENLYTITITLRMTVVIRNQRRPFMMLPVHCREFPVINIPGPQEVRVVDYRPCYYLIHVLRSNRLQVLAFCALVRWVRI